MNNKTSFENYFNTKKSIQLIIQTTLDCNLRCKHCYESNHAYPKQIMSLEVLEKIISLAQETYEKIDYLWFGGEPLLAGIEFFENVILLQEKCKKENTIIKNTVQTNGCLINNDFLKFFKENNFNISVSYDAQFNDELRQNTAQTEQAIQMCQQQGVHVTTISTITSRNCHKQFEMYKFLQERGLLGKFNRIFAEGNAQNNSGYLIENQEYIDAMKAFFDKWLFECSSSKTSSIDICLNSLFDLGPKECIYSGCLFKWLAVAPNGDIYPCPRFCGSEYVLGNVLNYSAINDVFLSTQYHALLEKTLSRVNNCKTSCKFFGFCHAGCNARCYWGNGLDEVPEDMCNFVKEFFTYIVSTISSLIDNNSICRTNNYFQDLYNKNINNFKQTCEYFKQNNLI